MKIYGYIVELQFTFKNGKSGRAYRSRVQPYLHVAENVVKHWEEIYGKANMYAVIIPLYYEEVES